jgi:hypothetical protein
MRLLGALMRGGIFNPILKLEWPQAAVIVTPGLSTFVEQYPAHFIGHKC